MRGKGHLTLVVSHMHRITPAYAGKSGGCVCLSVGGGDHPRVCGEKLFQSPLFRLPLGSPPRMRGKTKKIP